MREPEFEAMIGPAKLYPEIWRIVLGIVIIFFCYAGMAAILAVVLFKFVGPIEYFGWILRVSRPVEAVPMLMVLATFAGMLIGPVLAAGACHFRGPGTLFGPRDEFLRSFGITLAVCLPVYALMIGVSLAFDPPVENLAWEVWLGWLPIALPLIVLQILAEELVFRGYLQQQLAARFRARAVWMFLPSALFASLHWNPEAGSAIWMILAATFIFGLIAADLTEHTGSLGAAIGFHLVNNIFGILAISVSGSMTGLARWTTTYSLGDAGPLTASLGANLLFLAVVWRLLRWALDR
jgi:membrane protease YdiL (CAAX protease family)